MSAGYHHTLNKEQQQQQQQHKQEEVNIKTDLFLLHGPY
jgi:hypothetical protein